VTEPAVDEVAALAADLHTLRVLGLTRLRQARLDALRHALAQLERSAPPAVPGWPSAWPPDTVEALLRAAIARLGGGRLGEAAAYTFGLEPGTRDWPPPRRRAHAADLYEVGVDRFRKHYERLIIDQVAEAVLALCQANTDGRRPDGGAGGGAEPPAATASGPAVPAPRAQTAPAASAVPRTTTLVMPVGAARVMVAVTVHHRSLELLTDIDVLVSSENTYFEIATMFKSSVSASIRRAAAVRGAAGDVRDDVVRRELDAWMAEHAVPGLAVAPGTVAPTSGGELARQNIRRVYHAAVVSPKPGTNEYDVDPAVIGLAAANVFRLARAENAGGVRPPLSSVCFPLLGAGRGRLPPLASLEMIWTAVENEVTLHGSWDVHFVTRRAGLADSVVRWLAAAVPS